ncbi:MAG: hypothetical protein U9O94_04015 [Nanoarchaeota archaeon]|nr:hypothetical protein [Nanoarchaeota archaeon]
MVEAWFSDQTAIFVQEIGGTEINFTVDVLSLTESGFERETEGIVTFGDGRIVQKKPQKDGKVEIEFVMTDTTADKIFFGNTGTATAPDIVESGGDQSKHRIVLLRTDGTLPSSAVGAVTGVTAYRSAYAEAYAVTLEPTHEADGLLKGKLSFTVAPTDSDAGANVRKEVGLPAADMTTLVDYTTTNKFVA